MGDKSLHSGPSQPKSLRDVLQVDFTWLVEAFRRGEVDQMNAAGHRLQLHADIGGFVGVAEAAKRFWGAPSEGAELKATLTELGVMISDLPELAAGEAADRGAITGAQLAYAEFLMAQKHLDSANASKAWRSMSRAAEIGGLSDVQAVLDAYHRGLAAKDQAEVQRAADRLYQTMKALSAPQP